MVNPKIRRMMIVSLSILFMATVFRCQVYESTWGNAKEQINLNKQNQTEQINEAELDKFIEDMEKWKNSGLFEEKITSFDVNDISETIGWRAKVWFIYHQWEPDRFFYIQSRVSMLLKALKDKRDIENIIKQLKERDDEVSKSMLDLQKKRYKIIMKNQEELNLIEKKEALLKKII